MGVLDDAIRQHIELKRQHGASEEELRLQEAEALGPARRESPPTASAADAEPAATEAAQLGEPVEVADDPPVMEAPAEGFDSRSTTVMPAVDAEGDDLPEPEVFHEAPAVLEEPEPFDPFADDEPFADPPPPAREDAAGERDSEDVLEETPDFLQETPEHDRLWFEQKPPRDFDFDES